jgi:hypothetical protein
MSNNEKAWYEILKRRGNVPELSYPEFLKAAEQVVASIHPEKVTPAAALINRLEQTILNNRNLK